MELDHNLAAAPGAHRTPWALVGLIGAMTVLPPLSVDLYLPGLPAIQHEFAASGGATGATIAAFLAGLGLGQFFYGPLSDRIGRRPPLILGFAIYVAASLACVFASSIEWMIAARFAQALGACAGQVVTRASVRDRFDHQTSARILSLLMLVSGVGPIVAPILGGFLVSAGGWRTTFYAQAAVAAIIGLWMLLRFDESHPPEAAARARGETVAATFAALLKQPRLIGYMLAGGFNSAGFFGYIAAAPALLEGTYHVSPTKFGWLFASNAVGLIAVSQVNAHLLRRHSPETVLARARLISIVFAVALVVDAWTGFGGMIGVLVPLFFLLATFGMVNPNTMASALNVDPRRAGTVSSLMGASMFGLGGAVAVLVGAVHDGTARPMATIFMVCILISSAALYGVAKPLQSHASG